MVKQFQLQHLFEDCIALLETFFPMERESGIRKRAREKERKGRSLEVKDEDSE
jgi:hypothetical protein